MIALSIPDPGRTIQARKWLGDLVVALERRQQLKVTDIGAHWCMDAPESGQIGRARMRSRNTELQRNSSRRHGAECGRDDQSVMLSSQENDPPP